MVFCPEFVHRQHGGRCLPSLRFAVVGGKACHKCLVTWLRPLCLVSERVDHWKRGLYGSIVGWHIGLFVRHMRILHFANINFCVFSSFLSCLIAKQQFSRLVSLSVFLVGQLKGSCGRPWQCSKFLGKTRNLGCFFSRIFMYETSLPFMFACFKKSTARPSPRNYGRTATSWCVPF